MTTEQINGKSLSYWLTTIDAKLTALLEQQTISREQQAQIYTISQASKKLSLHPDTVRRRANELGLNPNGPNERKSILLTGEDLELIRTNDKATAYLNNLRK